MTWIEINCGILPLQWTVVDSAGCWPAAKNLCQFFVLFCFVVEEYFASANLDVATGKLQHPNTTSATFTTGWRLQ